MTHRARTPLMVGALGAMVVLTSLSDSVSIPGPGLTLNVEVDYLAAADHDHALPEAAVDALVQMFGCQGITLNIVQDDAIDHDLAVSWRHYDSLYNDHRDDSGWFYAVLVHSCCGRFKGRGELGKGLIMQTQVPPEPFMEARWFVHELGHAMFLGHGGNQDLNHKPNYPSVMNYRYNGGCGVGPYVVSQGFATDSCPGLKIMDFSHGTMPELDENNLDEVAGLGFGPIDWNCNGSIDDEPVARSLIEGSPCRSTDEPRRFLNRDHDDWTHIINYLSGDLQAVAGLSEGAIECGPEESVSEIDRFCLLDCDASRYRDAVSENCEAPFFVDTDGDGLDDYCDPCPNQVANTCCCLTAGDTNNDWCVDFADMHFLINFVFLSGPKPDCQDQADANGDNRVNTTDILWLRNFFYQGAPEPVCGTKNL